MIVIIVDDMCVLIYKARVIKAGAYEIGKHSSWPRIVRRVGGYQLVDVVYSVGSDMRVGEREVLNGRQLSVFTCI